MSEPLVGPDAASIENPGPAFDGGEGGEAAGVEPGSEADSESVTEPESVAGLGFEADRESVTEPEPAADPESEADPESAADAATLEAQLLATAPEEAIE